MRGVGALLASIGTSVLLVAAVTLSLLSISAVFALGGFESAGDASSVEALVLELRDRSPSGSDRAAGSPAVAVLGRLAPLPSRSAARSSARGGDTVRANSDPAVALPAGRSPAPSLDKGISDEPPAPQQPASRPPDGRKPAQNLGDGVKQLGDGLSSAVAQTGTTLAEATAPLAPPVGAALHQLMNIVAGLLKGTTDGLGGVLGATP